MTVIPTPKTAPATTPTTEMLELADEIEASDGIYCMKTPHGYQIGIKKTAQIVAVLRSAASPRDDAGMREPTEAMLNAARDWSVAKYGRGIGNDAAIGCWQAMLAALQSGSEKQ